MVELLISQALRFERIGKTKTSKPVYLNGTRRGILDVLPELGAKAAELITYLKKEYNLK